MLSIVSLRIVAGSLAVVYIDNDIAKTGQLSSSGANGRLRASLGSTQKAADWDDGQMDDDEIMDKLNNEINRLMDKVGDLKDKAYNKDHPEPPTASKEPDEVQAELDKLFSKIDELKAELHEIKANIRRVKEGERVKKEAEKPDEGQQQNQNLTFVMNELSKLFDSLGQFSGNKRASPLQAPRVVASSGPLQAPRVVASTGQQVIIISWINV